MLDREWIDKVRQATDIVDVVGRYVDLKREGKESVGLCPFHSERSPSFKVSSRKGFFHCFGCGQHGSSIDFLMLFSGLGFMDAVRTLAQEAGIPEPMPMRWGGMTRWAGQRKSPDRLPPPRPGLTTLRQEMRDRDVVFSPEQVESMYEAQTAAQMFFEGNLAGQEGVGARDYLFQTRGLSEEVARRYGLGWAPGHKDALLRAMPDRLRVAAARAGLLSVYESADKDKPALDPLDLSDDVMAAEAVVMVDRFRGRVTFPIRDADGRVCGFAGRSVPPDKPGSPKYLNTPATTIFEKGALLYGLFEARDAVALSGCVVVVEGYLDVIALAQAGHGNAVASMGTSCTADQIQALFGLCGEVIFCFDGDEAGKKAMRRALNVSLPLMDDQHRVKFLSLPPGDDPDSYVRRVGCDAFGAQRVRAPSLEEFALDGLREGIDLLHDAGRSALRERGEAMLSQMQPCLAQRRIAQQISEWTGEPVHVPRALGAKADANHPSRALSGRSSSKGQPDGRGVGGKPIWLKHLRIAAEIGRRHPKVALTEDLAGFIVRLVSMLEDGPDAAKNENPWGEDIRDMVGGLESVCGRADAHAGEISPEDLQNLHGAMRMSELVALDYASTLYLEREDLTQGEKLRLIHSLHLRKSELLRTDKQPSRL